MTTDDLYAGLDELVRTCEHLIRRENDADPALLQELQMHFVTARDANQHAIATDELTTALQVYLTETTTTTRTTTYQALTDGLSTLCTDTELELDGACDQLDQPLETNL